ncbi:MAG: DsrE/DsrF/DrsH-like family protein [Candidatus Marinimicrobia bacterium]|nr:DsrE/DsrF/DrsH-like family protein [Candidatus Neomarinimicrobiota bacterium]
MGVTTFIVNGEEKSSISPTLIMGAAAAAAGDEVIVFFTPGGAKHMIKGELEKIAEGKGLPNLIDLYEGMLGLGAEFMVCELAIENKGFKAEDFREEVEIGGATSYLNKVKDAKTTFTF